MVQQTGQFSLHVAAKATHPAAFATAIAAAVVAKEATLAATFATASAAPIAATMTTEQATLPTAALGAAAAARITETLVQEPAEAALATTLTDAGVAQNGLTTDEAGTRIDDLRRRDRHDLLRRRTLARSRHVDGITNGARRAKTTTLVFAKAAIFDPPGRPMTEPATGIAAGRTNRTTSTVRAATVTEQTFAALTSETTILAEATPRAPTAIAALATVAEARATAVFATMMQKAEVTRLGIILVEQPVFRVVTPGNWGCEVRLAGVQILSKHFARNRFDETVARGDLNHRQSR